MTALSSIALSGMQAAWTHMAVSGHNIANHDTPGFRSQQVVQSTQASGGVSVSIRQADSEGVSLAGELVDQMSASYTFKANLRTVQVEHDMLGTLLDMHA